jgi:hypothetical protein
MWKENIFKLACFLLVPVCRLPTVLNVCQLGPRNNFLAVCACTRLGEVKLCSSRKTGWWPVHLTSGAAETPHQRRPLTCQWAIREGGTQF